MIEKFLNYLQYEQNRSPLTVAAYAEDLRAFEQFFKNLDGQLSWQNVDTDVIRDWMESMVDKGKQCHQCPQETVGASLLLPLCACAPARRTRPGPPGGMPQGKESPSAIHEGGRNGPIAR